MSDDETAELHAEIVRLRARISVLEAARTPDEATSQMSISTTRFNELMGAEARIFELESATRNQRIWKRRVAELESELAQVRAEVERWRSQELMKEVARFRTRGDVALDRLAGAERERDALKSRLDAVIALCDYNDRHETHGPYAGLLSVDGIRAAATGGEGE